MKLAPRDINGFLAKPGPQTAIVVIYGPESGLVQERATLLLQRFLKIPIDPLAVVTMDGDNVAKDPAGFLDEANSLSLLGPAQRVIKIIEADDACTPALKDFAANPNPDVRVIVLAGNLTPRSVLRAFAEKDASAVALPCYVESEQEMQGFVAGFLRDNKIAVDHGAAAYLASQLVGDRLIARRQLEKLVLYKGPNPSPLTMDDIHEAIPDLAAQTLDDLVYASFEAQWPAMFRALDSLFGDNAGFMLILRSLQNHARRLEQVQMSIANGARFDEAVKTLQPPLFFKLETRFRNQIGQWDLNRLRRLQAAILHLEAEMKTWPADLGPALLGQTLIKTMSGRVVAEAA